MLTGCLFCERIPIGPEAGHFIHMNFNKPTDKTEGDFSLILESFWLYTNYPEDIGISKELKDRAGWDAASCYLLHKHIKPGDLCVNIGIDFGYFTEVMARLTGKDGKVISVSPVAEIIENYKTSTAKNDYADTAPIELYVEALEEEKRDVRFVYLRQNPGASYTKKMGRTHNVMGDRYFDIKEMISKPFKEIYDGPVDIALLKVSGTELEALQGFKTLPKTLVLEYTPIWSSEKTLDYIFDHYKVFDQDLNVVDRNYDSVLDNPQCLLLCILKDSII